MSYPKATCQHSCPQAVMANERAARWQDRHDALRDRVRALADEFDGSVVGTDFFGNPIGNWVPVARLRALLDAQESA